MDVPGESAQVSLKRLFHRMLFHRIVGQRFLYQRIPLPRREKLLRVKRR